VHQLLVRYAVSGIFVDLTHRGGVFERPLALGIEEDSEPVAESRDVDEFAQDLVGVLPADPQHLLHVESIGPELKDVAALRDLGEELVLGGVDVGDWGEGDVEVDFGPDVIVVESQGRKHHCGPIRVSEVTELLMAGLSKNIVDHGWQIILANLHEAEVPVALLKIGAEVEVMVWVLELMASTVRVAPRIAQPHIVSKVYQNVSKGPIAIANPGLSIRIQSMLQENHRLLLFEISALGSQPEQFEEVAILGGGNMALDFVGLSISDQLSEHGIFISE
jgi:hypothetical protein